MGNSTLRLLSPLSLISPYAETTGINDFLCKVCLDSLISPGESAEVKKRLPLI